MSVSRVLDLGLGLGSGQGRLSDVRGGVGGAGGGRGGGRGDGGCVAGLVGPVSIADIVNGGAVGDGVVPGMPGHVQHK